MFNEVPVSETNAQSIPALFRALNIVAEQIASLPWGVYRKDNDGTNEVTTHPLHKLVSFRPHPLYNTFEFRETIIRQVMLRGEAFVQVHRTEAGSISELEILPKALDIYRSKTGQYFYKFTDRTIGIGDVLHFKAYSLDGIRGVSPILVLAKALGLGQAQISHAYNYYMSGTATSGLLNPDAPMKPEQVDEALKYWNMYNTGAKNAGGVGILPYGVKYQALTNNLKDSEYVASRQATVEDIANMTGVPLDLLNSGDKASTYASAEQRMRQFVLFTLRTWCKRIEEEMNSKLFPPREMGKIFVRFNLDGLLRGDTEARAQFYNVLLTNGVLTRNEVRDLEGRNPIPGGDEPLTPLNMATGTQNNANDGQDDGETDV